VRDTTAASELMSKLFMTKAIGGTLLDDIVGQGKACFKSSCSSLSLRDPLRYGWLSRRRPAQYIAWGPSGGHSAASAFPAARPPRAGTDAISIHFTSTSDTLQPTVLHFQVDTLRFRARGITHANSTFESTVILDGFPFSGGCYVTRALFWVVHPS
jgi:hypothetical protein